MITGFHTCSAEMTDQGFGLVTSVQVPGAGWILLYEPPPSPRASARRVTWNSEVIRLYDDTVPLVFSYLRSRCSNRHVSCAFPS